MKTAFGEAQIPLTEIAGVRFPVGDDNSTTVVMLNGDSITGATDLKFLTVETEWGTAKINGQSIVSLLFVPGLQWEGTNSINGKRWALTETRPQSGANQSNPNNSSVGGAPRNSGSATINGVTIQGSGSVPLNAPFGNLNASPQAQPSQPLNIPRFQ